MGRISGAPSFRNPNSVDRSNRRASVLPPWPHLALAVDKYTQGPSLSHPVLLTSMERGLLRARRSACGVPLHPRHAPLPFFSLLCGRRVHERDVAMPTVHAPSICSCAHDNHGVRRDSHVAATYRHAYRTSPGFTEQHLDCCFPVRAAISCQIPLHLPTCYLPVVTCTCSFKKKNSVKGHRGHNRLGCVLGWLGCFRCSKMLQGGVWRDLHCTHGIKVPLPEHNLLRTCTSLCVAMFIEISNLVVWCRK